MSSPDDLAAVAENAEPTRQIREFMTWLGDGRKLTQRGRVTLADARTLVDRLGTEDVIDPAIGDRVFRTVSSTELPGLSLVVAWAKATRLVRVTHGRLVPVKRNIGLLSRPLELWTALLETFPQTGQAFLPSGIGESLLRSESQSGVGAMLMTMRGRTGAVPVADLCALAWERATAPYILDHATEQQLAFARRVNDRDARLALEVLERLGAVTLGAESAEFTALGRHGMRRLLGEPEAGDLVYQVLVTLEEVEDPPVWRRVLVPSAIRLDRLHHTIQAVMGWENSHLHVFEDGRSRYGMRDVELEHRDEGRVRLRDLVTEGGLLLYTYDFGDDWVHEIIVEKTVPAEPDARYPRCVAGEGACPPEDCGGPPGYEQLRDVLADPDDDDHENLLLWLGVDKPSEFDPGRFDIDEANRALAAGSLR